MPVYELIDEAKIFPGYGMVNPGDAPVVTSKFLDPTPDGFTLTGYGDAPWVTEYAGVIDGGISLTELAKYKSIEITNDSGALIECVANEDTSNPKPIVIGAVQEIEIDNDIWTLDITGSGTGNVYVVGQLK